MKESSSESAMVGWKSRHPNGGDRPLGMTLRGNDAAQTCRQ